MEEHRKFVVRCETFKCGTADHVQRGKGLSSISVKRSQNNRQRTTLGDKTAEKKSVADMLDSDNLLGRPNT